MFWILKGKLKQVMIDKGTKLNSFFPLSLSPVTIQTRSKVHHHGGRLCRAKENSLAFMSLMSRMLSYEVHHHRGRLCRAKENSLAFMPFMSRMLSSYKTKIPLDLSEKQLRRINDRSDGMRKHKLHKQFLRNQSFEEEDEEEDEFDSEDLYIVRNVVKYSIKHQLDENLLLYILSTVGLIVREDELVTTVIRNIIIPNMLLTIGEEELFEKDFRRYLTQEYGCKDIARKIFKTILWKGDERVVEVCSSEMSLLLRTRGSLNWKHIECGIELANCFVVSKTHVLVRSNMQWFVDEYIKKFLYFGALPMLKAASLRFLAASARNDTLTISLGREILHILSFDIGARPNVIDSLIAICVKEVVLAMRRKGVEIEIEWLGTLAARCLLNLFSSLDGSEDNEYAMNCARELFEVAQLNLKSTGIYFNILVELNKDERNKDFRSLVVLSLMALLERLYVDFPENAIEIIEPHLEEIWISMLSEEGLQSLSKYSEIPLPSLSRLLNKSKEVAEPAAQALVNLSQNSELARKMIQMGLIKVAMDMLYEPESCITRLLVMLLVNLTALDDGVYALLQIKDEKMKGLYIMKLVRSFCRSSGESSDDQFEDVGSILVNISKTEDGRKMLLEPKQGLLKQIIRQFDSTNQLRKKAVVGTILNCCYEAENQLENILLISEFLWPALLLPVAGSKTYSEQDISKMPPELGSALSIEREPVTDPDIRVQALHAIYLITLQEAGRSAFWSINGPRILEVGYEYEEDPKVMGAYEQVGSLLFG